MATPMGYGTLLECPYNKSHRVQATAMARHLFKCRKMHPNIEFVTCPFNHAHKVAEPELKMHTATCEDRANFDMYKYCITTAAATHTSTEAQEPELIYNEEDPIAPQKVRDDDDECWDDLRIPAYNPQEYCAKAKIIRKATLKTPAEKRAFYEEENKRHKELDIRIKKERGEDVDEAGSSNGDRKRRSRSRSPVRPRRRSRSPPPFRGRSPPRVSPESRPARRRSRSSSRGSRRSLKRRSPSPAASASRSRRSRSNSRKSRSLSPLAAQDRKRRRSPSVERFRARRSPSPDYRRAAAAPPIPRYSEYDRYADERERYARYAAYERSYGGYPARSERYDRYDSSYVRYPHYDYSGRYPARIERDTRRAVSRDREDEDTIYRRDFRD